MARSFLSLAVLHCIGFIVVTQGSISPDNNIAGSKHDHHIDLLKRMVIESLLSTKSRYDDQMSETGTSRETKLEYLQRLDLEEEILDAEEMLEARSPGLPPQNPNAAETEVETGAQRDLGEKMEEKRTDPMSELAIEHFSHLHEGDMCIRVCVDCRYRMSIAWAALCRKECHKGVIGNAFSYCFAAWHLEKGQ